MYKRFKGTVEKIVEKHGNMSLEQFYEEDQKVIKIVKEGFLPFTIEKNGDFLYIGYYRRQNGDSISDPIFVFELREGIWHPIKLEQVLGHTSIGKFEQGRYYYNARQFNDVRQFATLCAKEWKWYYLE